MCHEHISPEPNTGCWLWTGAVDSKGYGLITEARSIRYAHKAMFEDQFGAVSDGLELDHVCRVHACVNPAHLEPVTHAENCRRGNAGQHNKIKTHCPSGHEYSTSNTITYSDGKRRCRECLRLQWKSQRGRQSGRRVNS